MNWLVTAAVAALLAAPLVAETLAEMGDLVIENGEARSAGPAARTGAGYFTVTNTGEGEDRLLEIRSEAASRVELHTTELENGVARMVPVGDGVAVPAGESVSFEQGGLHAMFMGLTDAWDTESGVPVTLVFERAGEVAVILPVTESPAAGGRGNGHEGHGG